MNQKDASERAKLLDVDALALLDDPNLLGRIQHFDTLRVYTFVVEFRPHFAYIS
jgi:hypothetical protein